MKRKRLLAMLLAGTMLGGLLTGYNQYESLILPDAQAENHQMTGKKAETMVSWS